MHYKSADVFTKKKIECVLKQKHKTYSIRVCEQAQRKSYKGTKTFDNLSQIFKSPSSQFLTILNIIPMILSFNPYITPTKAMAYILYYVLCLLWDCLLLMHLSSFGVHLCFLYFKRI